MKKLFLFIVLLILFPVFVSYSQKRLAGIWKGNFENEFQSTELSWKFIDGRYEMDMNQDGSIEVSGNWEINDNQLYLWDITGPMACPESQKGIYIFDIKGDTLSLKLVEDKCPGRKMMVPNVNWKRE
jgi:hypothetical protein